MEDDNRRASSRGIIPKAKIKTIKMTFVIVFGKFIRHPIPLSIQEFVDTIEL